METLKRHLPFSGQEGLQELKQIAIRFEEKIYSAATNQVFCICLYINLDSLGASLHQFGHHIIDIINYLLLTLCFLCAIVL